MVVETKCVSESATPETMKDVDDDNEEEEVDVEQKKYMGVACVQCKCLKEEKEKHLKEIANDGDSPQSTVELIATLGVTATTMRKDAAVDVNSIVGNGGSK